MCLHSCLRELMRLLSEFIALLGSTAAARPGQATKRPDDLLAALENSAECESSRTSRAHDLSLVSPKVITETAISVPIK
jgi:hypothetical protein